ncbi:hypothetical protein Anas_09043 [Armadillidium nasatum]|uniref:Uncharacterized protein n=1 Tax=Armadillidium nasatum TaxID=96803 RepID=A0A5N5T751_9CRUS|nr:hypothetical protein Anas_09043 [Armadillidium nasatum]
MALYLSINHKMEDSRIKGTDNDILSDLYSSFDSCILCRFLRKSYHAFLAWIIGTGLRKYIYN